MVGVTKILAALAAFAFAGAFAWQEAKIAKLSGLIGEWDVKLEIKEPPEIAGAFTGTAKFSWDPNKQHIRAEGSLVIGDGKVNYGSGFLSFDDDGPGEAVPDCQRAAGADVGRVLTMRVKLKVKLLILDDMPLKFDENKDIRLVVTTDIGKDKIVVHVDLPEDPKPSRLLELTLTRKK